MELKEWAIRILSADTLEEKLLEPGRLTDQDPGSPIFWNQPSRPSGMEFQKHSRKDKLPALINLDDPNKRAVCLHRFAGHELLAVEIMAYALLAFPNAPKHFRKGLANTLIEEQEHVRLYMKEMNRLGVKFGDLPLYKHFWAYTRHLSSPEKYISVMSLTLEMANLDFAPTFGKAFAKCGDIESSQLMERILKDEIAHVSFGWNWLRKFKSKELSQWQAWTSNLPSIIQPNRAKGVGFYEDHRIKAGISEQWLTSFKENCFTDEKAL